MDPAVFLIGMTLAGSIALTVLYAHRRVTTVGRLAGDRALPISPGAAATTPMLRVNRQSSLTLLSWLPVSAKGQERTELELERAGIPLSVGEFLALRLLAAIAGSVLAAVATRGLDQAVVVVTVAAGAFVLGWLIPGIWLGAVHRRRLAAMDAQVAEALMTVAKALRVGTGVIQALAYTAEKTPAPLGLEIERTLRELRLGLDSVEAFNQLAARVGSDDLDIAVNAIVIQRSVGGNLSEILTTVVRTIHERNELKREVETITSRQKLLGNLMSAVPVLIGIAFITLNPDLGRLLIETTAGRIALAVGIAFEVVGLLLIRRFAHIEI
jgi:tight adherence protein B